MSAYSDFERNWYMNNGFGDPNATRDVWYQNGSRIDDPRNFQAYVYYGRNGGRWETRDLTKVGGDRAFGAIKQQEQIGVSDEARAAFLRANPSAAAASGGPAFQNATGTGTISNTAPSSLQIPQLQDPNQGRSSLRIRRAR